MSIETLDLVGEWLFKCGFYWPGYQIISDDNMTYSETYLNNVLNFRHMFQSLPLSQEVIICLNILVKRDFLIIDLSQPSLSDQKWGRCPLTWSFSSSPAVAEHTLCFCYLHWELGEHNWRRRHKENEGREWTFFITFNLFF